jgi:hypothetical protein
MQQGYSIAQRTDTSLAANRRKREGMFGHSLRSLTVVALPQPQGGVQIKLRGDDREGVQERQAEWSEWAESLPKKEEVGEVDSGTTQRSQATSSDTEALATSEEQRAWAPAAPWERKLRATAAKAEQGVDFSIGAEAEETSTHVPEIEEPEAPSDEKTTSKVVEAESFRLVNNRGELRALLTAHDDSPHLAFMDQEEKVRLMLNTNSEGNPTVAMTDDKGNIRVRLAVGHDGSPVLDFGDNNAELRFRLSLEDGERPQISIGDEQGTPRAALKENPDGQFVLGFLDDNGEARVVIGLEPDGASSLNFRNENGDNRITLLSNSDDTQGLLLYDRNNRPRLVLHMGSDGEPMITLTNNEGEMRTILRAGDPNMILLDSEGNVIWREP